MPTRDDVPTVQIDNARLIFNNFQGKENQFNRNGEKSFCVILDEENARVLEHDGWNVKWLAEREEGERPTPIINIGVRFDIFPPKIILITSTGEKYLNDDTVESLDWLDLAQVDLIFRAYDWEFAGKNGRKAYLKTMFVTIEEDALEKRYAAMRTRSETHE